MQWITLNSLWMVLSDKLCTWVRRNFLKHPVNIFSDKLYVVVCILFATHCKGREVASHYDYNPILGMYIIRTRTAYGIVW